MDSTVTDTTTRDLLNYVVEFLQFLDFPNALKALSAERDDKRQALSSSINTRAISKDSRERLRADLLRKFDEGKRDDFLGMWTQYVPASQLGYDYATQKFEFYLQLYFAIYPVLPSSSVLIATPGSSQGQRSGSSGARHELAQRMKGFKAYLETRGAGLAHTPEFLPYYALPYVPQPEHHPSFEHLFDARWVAEQRLRLKQFLEGVSAKVQDLPKLYAMYEQHLKATEGVPRLSPQDKALRTSSRASSRAASREGALSANRPFSGLGLPAPPGTASGSRPNSSLAPIRRLSGTILDNTVRGSSGTGRAGTDGGYSSPDRAAATGGLQASRGSAGGMPPLPPQRSPRGACTPVPVGAPVGPSPATPPGVGANRGGVSSSDGLRVLTPATAAKGIGSASTSERGDDEEGSSGEDVAEEADGPAGAGGGDDDDDATPSPASSGDEGDYEPDYEEGSADGDMEGLAEALRSSNSAPTMGGGAAGSDGEGDGGGGPGGPGGRTGGLGRLGSTALLGASIASLSALGTPGGGGILRDSVHFLEDTYRSDGGSILAPLDYRRLKRDLVGNDAALCTRLLQALRWRLTRSRPGSDRWHLIGSWAEADLLDCHSPQIKGSAVQQLAAANDERVHAELCRLCNALSSDRLGRNYLMLPGGEVVPSLMAVMRRYGSLRTSSVNGALPQEGGGGGAAAAGDGGAQRDVSPLQQALVALQKLSLRRAAQSRMVALGVVRWVVDFLQDLESVSDFTVEYGTALLMNLCLRSAGRAAAEAAGTLTGLLRLCENLLESTNDQVRTYIHGTLYSVFSRRAIREASRQRGTPDLLEAVAQSAPPVFASQIEHILRRLNEAPEAQEGPEPAAIIEEEPAASDDGDGPDGDADFADGDEEAFADDHHEEDEDLRQSLIRAADQGGPCGEELLCSAYLASSEDAQQQVSAVRSSMAAAAAAAAVASASGRLFDTSCGGGVAGMFGSSPLRKSNLGPQPSRMGSGIAAAYGADPAEPMASSSRPAGRAALAPVEVPTLRASGPGFPLERPTTPSLRASQAALPTGGPAAPSGAGPRLSGAGAGPPLPQPFPASPSPAPLRPLPPSSPAVGRSNSSTSGLGSSSLSLTAAAQQARAAGHTSPAAARRLSGGPLSGIRTSGGAGTPPSASPVGSAGGFSTGNSPTHRAAKPPQPPSPSHSATGGGGGGGGAGHNPLTHSIQSRAERAADKLRSRLGPVPAGPVGASLVADYVHGFGARRELPRTPSGNDK